VSILGQRPREEQNVFLNACDVGLVSLIPGMLGRAMPSRTYNILAAGKPIIALTDEGSELAQLIDEREVGWHSIPGDPSSLVQMIREAMRDGVRLDEMGRRSRITAETEYSPEIAINRYRELFQKG